MKVLLAALTGVAIFAATIPAANAVTCAAGVYRAGCVGPHGAVVTHRPVVAHHCVWRAGVRVCR